MSDDKRSELQTHVKYCNNLPDVPFDLKFIRYPFESDRFSEYTPTSLEWNHKYELLTDHDLGVTIDLINRDLYQPNPDRQLHPDDKKLLEAEEEEPHTLQDSLRSRHHSRSVSWLRRSEYISTEPTRFQQQNMRKVEAKVGYNVKKRLQEETPYLNREAQIKAIEKTFADSKKEITKHHTKPNVVPLEVHSVFPDFKNWKYSCAQVSFDSDPAPIGKSVPAQLEEMSQAMICGFMNEGGEEIAAYLLPSESTLEKRRKDFINNVLYEDDEEYEYKIAREYNWNVNSNHEENYFFVVRPDGVFYDKLQTRIRLSKRRQKIGQQPNNTKLVVKHRPSDANEHRMQRYREEQLEPLGDEDEEDDVEIDHEHVEAGQTRVAAGQDKNEDDFQRETGRDSGSRSRSKAKSRSVSSLRSRSKTESISLSQSHSKSKSVSRSMSPIRNRESKSRSHTKSKSRSRSHSASRSGSKLLSR